MTLPLIPFVPNIPFGPNNPSQDQPNMQANTNSDIDIWEVDHIGFNVNNSGIHAQVTMPVQSGIPTTAQAGATVTYTKTSGQSQEFMTSDTGAKEYQITRFIDADFSTFGANASLAPNPGTGGWTFLPGGIIMQYGTFPAFSTGSVDIVFPITYTTLYNIQVSFVTPGTSPRAGILYQNPGPPISPSNSGFTAFLLPSSALNTLYWMALGV